ncbi:AraC family transcriptional regulator [Thermoanaerobacterium sp. R66]|uniref:AraC family transcriptional regulator n=1 Tax=Thermoanaerobacterium sp. R66 TaxID=2742479 RepID=UPI001778A9C5|nr:AraC family transcriptional regulator [Thermoanaerobacterium sp. R66]MDE4542475.1 helix-turn-helix domain-containing protein [Thermoanaerobacterium sp. R66]HHV75256.1 AraC family transcriptional regulator [Thermoanaerobacterium sp.]
MKKFQKFNQSQQMKHQYFEIYHYSGLDDTNININSHYHSHYEIYIFIDGSIDYVVEGNLYSLKPRDVLFISPHDNHYPILNTSTGKYERIVIWLSKEYMDELYKLDNNIYFSFNKCRELNNKLIRLDKSRWQPLYALLLMVIDEYYSNNMSKDLLCYSLISQFLVHLNRSVYFQGPFVINKSSDDLLNKIISYITTNATNDLSLEKISSEFYISKYYLSHLFKEKIGVSVYSYILQRRLTIAKNMILSNVPISKIYEQCGFKDYAGFYRAFKKEFGLSPNEFKKLYQKNIAN